MSKIGDIKNNKATQKFGVVLHNAPEVSREIALSKDSSLNQTHLSGKRLGSLTVISYLNSSKERVSGLYAAAGSTPTAPWKLAVALESSSETLPVITPA